MLCDYIKRCIYFNIYVHISLYLYLPEKKNCIVETRRKWITSLKYKRKRTINPELDTILYPVKIPFRSKGEIKTFSDEGNLREFLDRRPVLK